MKSHEAFVKIDENSQKDYENSPKIYKIDETHQKFMKFTKIMENSPKMHKKQ